MVVADDVTDAMNADIVLVFTQRLEHFQGMLPGMGSSSSTPSVVYITLTCSPDDFRQFKGDYESGSVRVECTVFADTAYSLSVAKAEYMVRPWWARPSRPSTSTCCGRRWRRTLSSRTY